MKALAKRKDIKGWRLALLFLACAVLALAVLLIPFLVRGNHLVWAIMERDGATQHLTFLAYLREVGWLKAVGAYDFSFGLGADFLTSMGFMSLFDPFNVLIFILPFDIVWVYDVIILLKFVAAGAAMLVYLRRRGVRGGYALGCALGYMLCGYIVFTFARHLNLTSGAIWLPLMILGLEQVYKKRQPFLFIGVSFLCLINSFYMFFFNSVFVVLYAFFYHGEACREEGTKYWRTLVPRLWKVAAYYLLAILLAAFVLLPTAYAYLHAARGGSKGLNWQTLQTYFLELLSFCAPSNAGNYSPLMLNVAALFMAVAAFFLCNKRGFALRCMSAVLAVGFMVPLFGYAMNLFNYSNNRWVYLLSFSVFAMIGVSTAGEGGDAPYSVPLRRKVAKTVSVYAALLCDVGGVYLLTVLGGSGLGTAAKVALSALAVLAMAAVTAVCVWALSKKSFFRDKRAADGSSAPPRVLDGAVARAAARPSVLMVLSAVLAVVYALCFCCVYSSQHRGAAVYRTLFSEEEAYVAEQNQTEFFRTDVQAADTWWSSFNNRGVNNGYMGTVFYNSMNGEETYSFVCENQLYDPQQNLGLAGLDDRAALQTLLSCRYYYGEDGVYYNAGFTRVGEFDALFENTNYVPFGFVYTDTLSREYYDSLDPLLRQYAMLEGLVVEGDGTLARAEGLGALEPLYASAEGQPFSVTRQEQTFTVRGCAGKEVYVRLSGAEEVESNAEFRVRGNGKTRTYRFTPRGSNMYSDQRDACICLGVPEADELEITISAGSGSVTFDSFEILAYDMAAFEAAADELQQAEHLANVTFDGSHIRGDVTTQGGWMFFSLPYSSGWSVTVDGQERELLRANGNFMAVQLEAGEHTVELSYETPYLTLGAYVSCAACAVLAAVVVGSAVVYVRRKRTGRRQ